MMKRAAFLIAVLTAAPLAAGWDKVWNDGRAEVAVYDAQRVADDKPRDYRETLIVSREDVHLSTLGPVTGADKKIAVYKFNASGRFDAANYPHSYLTSVYARRDAPGQVLKISAGWQEWMGNRFRIYTSTSGNGGELHWHSYVEAEGDKAVPVASLADDLFEDGLPLALRALPFKDGYTLKTRLWSGLSSGGPMIEPKVSPAIVRVAGEETVHCHAGGLPSWKVTVEHDGVTDTYWMEKADPHIMTRMETADGRKRLLYGRSRWSFWDKRLPRPNVLN